MAANSFLEQRQSGSLSFGIVLGLHAAAIAGVLLIKGPVFQQRPDVIPRIYDVPPDTPPPPIENPPAQPDRQLVRPPISRLDVPERIIPAPAPSQSLAGETLPTPSGPIAGTDPLPPPGTGTGTGANEFVRRPPPDPIPQPLRDPVRIAAQFDPRFMGSVRPPYPAGEERAEREGQVAVRVTIGPDGRVTAVERVSATSDAFWRATQRQALSRWRFKPATVDGRPVQSSKVVTIAFKLDER